MQDLSSQICVEQPERVRTHFADLYEVTSNASLNLISSVHRDTACHENSQQEMNLAIEIVDTAVSRTAKDTAATQLWVVFESQRAYLRDRLAIPDRDGPCPLSSFRGALWIARREFQLKSGPREAG